MLTFIVLTETAFLMRFLSGETRRAPNSDQAHRKGKEQL
jgi:hypothetical protein